jgi:hypothetical protein
MRKSGDHITRAYNAYDACTTIEHFSRRKRQSYGFFGPGPALSFRELLEFSELRELRG